MNDDNDLIKKHIDKIAKAGSIAFAGKILNNLIGFPTKILLAQFLGPTSLGIFSLGKNILSWGTRISLMGLHKAAVKFIAQFQGEEAHAKVKGTIIYTGGISMVLSLISGTLLFLFSRQIGNLFGKKQVESVLRALCIALPFLVQVRITQYVLEGYKNVKRSVILKVVKSVSWLISLSVVLLLGYRLYGAVWMFILSSILPVFLGIFYIIREDSTLLSSLTPEVNLKKLFRFAVAMSLAGFMWVMIRRVDILMLGYFSPSADVGIYSVVSTLSILIAFPLQSINKIFSPIISDLNNKEKTDVLGKLYGRLTRWIYALGLPICLMLVLFPENILGFLFGPEYVTGATVLIILVLFEFMNISVGPVGNLLQMTGHQNWNFAINAFSALLNVILNIVFIPLYGIVGAGLATGISLVVNNWLELMIVYNKLRIIPWNKRYFTFLFPVLTSIGAFYLLQTLSVGWVLNAILVLMVYAVSIYLFALDEKDELILKTLAGSVVGFNKS